MLACRSHLHSKDGVSAAEAGEGEHGRLHSDILGWSVASANSRQVHALDRCSHHKPSKFKIFLAQKLWW